MLALARQRRCDVFSFIMNKTETLEQVDQRLEEIVNGPAVDTNDYWCDIREKMHSCMEAYADSMVVLYAEILSLMKKDEDSFSLYTKLQLVVSEAITR